MGLIEQGKVTKHHGRIFVVLADEDGDDIFPHGIVVCPAGIEDKGQALAAVEDVFRQIVQADPEEWNYDDVIAELEAKGFEWVGSVYGVENRVKREQEIGDRP